MKVIVDDKIPYIREVLSLLADKVVYAPGAAIDADMVRDADAMIVRTRTHCNEQLLKGSTVRFIATATIGFDHLDTKWLKDAGIQWTNCPGCNASSVGQYLHSTLLLLNRDGLINLEDCTLGIVGVGHVGREVLKAAEKLGLHILLNDPPLEAQYETEALEKELGHRFASLSQLAETCDVLTFHTPLTRSGKWPTYHMVDGTFLHTLKKKPVLINSSRGEVVDNAALLEALNEDCLRQAVIDTWENEPNISLPLLDKVYLGTPHIAGYSADGKANATRMSLKALCLFFKIEKTRDGRPADTVLATIQPPSLPASVKPASGEVERALQLYNPHADSLALKKSPSDFELLRGNYPLRREHF